MTFDSQIKLVSWAKYLYLLCAVYSFIEVAEYIFENSKCHHVPKQ